MSFGIACSLGDLASSIILSGQSAQRENVSIVLLQLAEDAVVVRLGEAVDLPAVLVIFAHALLRRRDHLVEGAAAAGIEHALNADVLVFAGAVSLVELFTPDELAVLRVPDQLYHLSARP